MFEEIDPIRDFQSSGFPERAKQTNEYPGTMFTRYALGPVLAMLSMDSADSLTRCILEFPSYELSSTPVGDLPKACMFDARFVPDGFLDVSSSAVNRFSFSRGTSLPISVNFFSVNSRHRP